MPDVFEIADIFVEHALRAHEDEIALIAYYGSYAKETASVTSDLDLFYIADAGKARSLSSQFVIDGLPYDFWPISWEFAEGIANADADCPWAVAASLIADARVLYYRSPKELARFKGLQARIEELTQPEQRPLMVNKALDVYDAVLFRSGQVRLAVQRDDKAGAHWAAQQLVNAAANCLALMNQTYFSKGWGANFEQILALPERPADLERLMHAVLTPAQVTQLPDAAERLARAIRATLRDAQRSLVAPQDAQRVFKDFYFFVFEYVNKILAAREDQDAVRARFAAFQLQEEIAQFMNRVDQGFAPQPFNLLGEYIAGYERAGFPDLLTSAVAGDIDELAERARQLDVMMRAWLTQRGVDLGIVESRDDLRRFLETRDPAQ
ncbi:MAG: kanamycin nucleotidyltransferase C-terminal domain-containing protein [Anaerolineae bacterium]